MTCKDKDCARNGKSVPKEQLLDELSRSEGLDTFLAWPWLTDGYVIYDARELLNGNVVELGELGKMITPTLDQSCLQIEIEVDSDTFEDLSWPWLTDGYVIYDARELLDGNIKSVPYKLNAKKEYGCHRGWKCDNAPSGCGVCRQNEHRPDNWKEKDLTDWYMKNRLETTCIDCESSRMFNVQRIHGVEKQ